MAMTIFLVISGIMFGLLQLSQQRYTSETQLSGAFQETRLAIDQIVRDFSVAGFPSQTIFSVLPAPTQYAVGPVAWSPNYPGGTCLIGTAGGGTCTSPGDFDLIIETNLGDGAGMKWIRYQLQGTTLLRTAVPKVPGDPVAGTAVIASQVPFLVNVMNNAPGAQLAQITAAYPGMFPGGVAQPIFQYTCATQAGPQPCPLAGANGVPLNIVSVDINLIVMTQQPDLQTQAIKLVQLTGRGMRINPTN